MSFLKPAPDATAAANPMASGLGHLFNTDPSRVSAIADRIGRGMNLIAAGGGAQPGYAPPEPSQDVTANHLQLLDPSVLQALVQRFRPASTGVQYQ